ncbi:GTPase [Aureococcus anophagefferens]|nr:GTPase [Aureococcus anophagefferens]
MEPARVRGYTALALMLVTWVVQSEIVQSIEEKANRPFLITFLNHASMALLVPFLPSGAFAALVATAGASKRRVAAVAAALSIVYTAGDCVLGIAVSLGGVSLVACDGSSAAGGRRFLGDMLVVGGAASYAAYEVCFARWLGDAAGPVVNAATALVGVASLATTRPSSSS